MTTTTIGDGTLAKRAIAAYTDACDASERQALARDRAQAADTIAAARTNFSAVFGIEPAQVDATDDPLVALVRSDDGLEFHYHVTGRHSMEFRVLRRCGACKQKVPVEWGISWATHRDPSRNLATLGGDLVEEWTHKDCPAVPHWFGDDESGVCYVCGNAEDHAIHLRRRQDREPTPVPTPEQQLVEALVRFVNHVRGFNPIV